MKTTEHSPIGKWLVRRNYVRSIKSANDVVIIFCICIFIFAAYVALLPVRMKLNSSLIARSTTVFQTR